MSNRFVNGQVRVEVRNSVGTPSSPLVIDGQTGNVGVGIDTPLYTLDVAGTIKTNAGLNVIGGSILLGGTAKAGNATNVMVVTAGTAPTVAVPQSAVIFSANVRYSDPLTPPQTGATIAYTALQVLDSNGNITTLSPHNFSLIPEGPSENMAWSYYSERAGNKINVDMLKLARLVEKITGEKLVYTEAAK